MVRLSIKNIVVGILIVLLGFLACGILISVAFANVDMGYRVASEVFSSAALVALGVGCFYGTAIILGWIKRPFWK